MTRQLSDHHNDTTCPVCAALVEEIAALRLAKLNAETERDAAHAECARLPYPHYRDEWAELVGL